MAWEGEVFRAVIFPASGDYDAAELWTAIAGESPPNVQRSQLPPQMKSLATGAWGSELFLQLAVQIGRVEAAITAIDPNPNEPTPLPHLRGGALQAAVSAARDAGAALARRIPTQRIAAHAQLVEDVANEQDATRRLNEILGGVFPGSTTDQLFQVNAPKSLAGATSRMNRLVKWGSLSLKQVTVAVAPGGITSQGDVGKSRELVFMHLDVNNAPVAEALAADAAVKLTDELWREAGQIIEGGRDVLS